MVIKFTCSNDVETNITHAVQYFPLADIAEMNLLFVCIDSSDARRLVMENYEDF